MYYFIVYSEFSTLVPEITKFKNIVIDIHPFEWIKLKAANCSLIGFQVISQSEYNYFQNTEFHHATDMKRMQDEIASLIVRLEKHATEYQCGYGDFDSIMTKMRQLSGIKKD